jgi:hypothetical protein
MGWYIINRGALLHFSPPKGYWRILRSSLWRPAKVMSCGGRGDPLASRARAPVSERSWVEGKRGRGWPPGPTEQWLKKCRRDVVRSWHLWAPLDSDQASLKRARMRALHTGSTRRRVSMPNWAAREWNWLVALACEWLDALTGKPAERAHVAVMAARWGVGPG